MSLASLLSNMPSRGNFTNTSEKIVLSPPDGKTSFVQTEVHGEPQILKTDTTNILIRSLILRKQRQLSTAENPPRPEFPTPSCQAQVTMEEPSLSSNGKKRAHEALSSSDNSPSKRFQPGSSRSLAHTGLASTPTPSLGDSSRDLHHEGGASSGGSSTGAGGLDDSASKAGGGGSSSSSLLTSPPPASVGTPGTGSRTPMLTLSSMKVESLRERCREMGLSASGRKEQLINRLLAMSPGMSGGGSPDMPSPSPRH